VVASDATPSQSRWSRWFSKSAEAEAPAAPPAAATAAPAPSTPSGGGFQLQLANSRSEAEAQALWKKVSSENQEVAGAKPVIEKVDIGNFGTFYSLKIGPFPDKAESLKVCNALKRNAIDCSLVTQ
jgi:cell division septation protein DedD